MSERRWYQFDGMEEKLFKQAPDGWVYRAPNPWFFGPSRHCLLNDEQKSKVASTHRQMWDASLLAIVVVVVAVLPLAKMALSDNLWIQLAAVVGVGLATWFLLHTYLVQKVRPIIAGLPPTTHPGT